MLFNKALNEEVSVYTERMEAGEGKVKGLRVQELEESMQMLERAFDILKAHDDTYAQYCEKLIREIRGE